MVRGIALLVAVGLACALVGPSTATAQTTCPPLPAFGDVEPRLHVALGGSRFPRPEKRLPVRIEMTVIGADPPLGDPFTWEGLTMTISRADGSVAYTRRWGAVDLPVSAVGWRPPAIRRNYTTTVVAVFSYTDAAGVELTCTAQASRRFRIDPKIANPRLGSRFTGARISDDVARAEGVFLLRYELRDQTGQCNAPLENECDDFFEGIDSISVTVTLNQGRREITSWDGTGDSFDGRGSAEVRIPYSLLSFGRYRWVATLLHPLTFNTIRTSGWAVISPRGR